MVHDITHFTWGARDPRPELSVLTLQSKKWDGVWTGQAVSALEGCLLSASATGITAIFSLKPCARGKGGRARSSLFHRDTCHSHQVAEESRWAGGLVAGRPGVTGVRRRVLWSVAFAESNEWTVAEQSPASPASPAEEQAGLPSPKRSGEDLAPVHRRAAAMEALVELCGKLGGPKTPRRDDRYCRRDPWRGAARSKTERLGTAPAAPAPKQEACVRSGAGLW